MFRSIRMHCIPCLLLMAFIPFEFRQVSFAQQPTQAGQSPERRLPHDLLQDQNAIWTSPAHIKKHDVKWLVPFVAATAGLIVSDSHNSGVLGGSDNDDLSLSHGVANAGVSIMAGAFGVSYLIGHLRHNSHAVETGVLGGAALADSALVANLMKLATNRRRPDSPGADGDFWSGGKSFPSGHSIMSWTAASVVSERYPDRPLVRLSAYSVAAAVSLTRVTGKNHYPSDVVVGAVFGYLIGRYVVRHRGMP